MTGKCEVSYMPLIIPQIFVIAPDVTILKRMTVTIESPALAAKEVAYYTFSASSLASGTSYFGSCIAAMTRSSIQPGSKSLNFALTQADYGLFRSDETLSG